MSTAAVPDTSVAVQPDREPKIVAFVCGWCSSLGADLAGADGCQYPAGVRVLRVPCCSRINPMHIVNCLQKGVDGVLVVGCHPGDCHYHSGNLVANRKFALVKRFLEYLGVEPERFQYAWVSGAEGSRFAALARKIVDEVRPLGPAALLKQ